MKILNFVYFGVEESGISVCLVAAVNGAGVNKKTNITYVDMEVDEEADIVSVGRF